MEFEFIGDAFRLGDSLVLTIPFSYVKKHKVKPHSRIRAKIELVG